MSGRFGWAVRGGVYRVTAGGEPIGPPLPYQEAAELVVGWLEGLPDSLDMGDLERFIRGVTPEGWHVDNTYVRVSAGPEPGRDPVPDDPIPDRSPGALAAAADHEYLDSRAEG